MMGIVAVLGMNALILVVFVLLQWLASVRLRDASIVDRFWGAGFALVAVATALYVEASSVRGMVLTGMAVVWGMRLSIYLTWRNWGTGEDYRYQAMRKRHGARFSWVSLFTVFVLQGALTWFISLPLQVGIAMGGPDRITAPDMAGALIWIAGLAFESIGDYQLARFKSDPSNAGGVMCRGLWKYTRHPNYFGDAMVWWGVFLVAASAPYAVYTVLSPALMHFFLMRVSGVVLLEKKLMKSRPGYAEYVARTNAFYPWPPMKSARADSPVRD